MTVRKDFKKGIMRSEEIRERFLAFFTGKGHKIYESDLLVPKNDPSLLFTGAGMNQFKEQFMGIDIEHPRAASCQKCLRTGDIDKVGRTPRHHTFFEMLGNFSFGDYFKAEAIEWAWEFLTGELAIEKERLRVSVYEDDEEAYSIWTDKVGLSGARLTRLGPGDNFWPADAPSKGPDGPCGPCSEIFYDRGKEHGCHRPDCGVACDCGRFVEIWNLVFTEYERRAGGELLPLPNKNIDTGMGLERVASVMQEVNTNFEIDIIAPLVDEARKLLGGDAVKETSELNLIADHLRAVVFAVSDGIAPSNESRGYVVRKLIRRAYLAGGSAEPFLFKMVPLACRLMKRPYPDVSERAEHIAAVLRQEEEKFQRTLSEALPLLDEKLACSADVLQGQDIFELVDTYGLPVEVITARTRDKGKKPDLEGFHVLMEQRREISRCGSGFGQGGIFQTDVLKEAEPAPFSDDMPLKAELTLIARCGEKVDSLKEGEKGEILISPQSGVFYAAGGGQVGDKGHVTKPDGRMRIVDTVLCGGNKVFFVEVDQGSFATGDEIIVYDDSDRKRRIAANHSATHLLQAALRKVLGEHVKQSGSAVDEDRLRFDFTHTEKLSTLQVLEVEELVNSWIGQGVDICKEQVSLKDAKSSGALSFFGEKYDDQVRVVSIGGFSKELCGGSHVDNSAEIGVFKIISESSIASGLRRIEALTGRKASEWMRKAVSEELSRIETLRSEDELPQDEAFGRGRDLLEGEGMVRRDAVRDFSEKLLPQLERLRAALEKKIKKRQRKDKAREFDSLKEHLDRVARDPVTLSGVRTYFACLDDTDMRLLRQAAGYLQKKAESGIIVLAGRKEGKASLICAVAEDIVDAGFSARELVNVGAPAISGGGGGRETFAQAGGSAPQGLEKALHEIKNAIETGREDETC